MATVVKRGTKARPRFYGQYRDANGVRRTRLLRGATSAEQARIMAAAIDRNVMQGKLGIEEPAPEEQVRSTITVQELSERFLREYAPPDIKDIDNYRLEARSVHKVRILPAVGSQAAASVRMSTVERLRDAELTKRSRASAVQTLAALSKLYVWGNKVGLISCPNPVQGCERPRSTSSIDYLSREEVGKLLAYSEDHAPDIYPMIATAVYCGLRKGELYGLRWSDVSLEASRIDVMRSYRSLPKSGKPRHVPMHPELVRVLRQWRSCCPVTDAGLVFPIDNGRGQRMGDETDMRALANVLDAAGCHVPKKPWHALRHTFASHAVMSGTPLYDVQQLLGHSKPMMTQHYAHLAPAHLASAVARLSFTSPVDADIASIDEERRKRATKT